MTERTGNTPPSEPAQNPIFGKYTWLPLVLCAYIISLASHGTATTTKRRLMLGRRGHCHISYRRHTLAVQALEAGAMVAPRPL